MNHEAAQSWTALICTFGIVLIVLNVFRRIADDLILRRKMARKAWLNELHWSHGEPYE